MRIGLIAALRRSDEGPLRAGLPLAGTSVLARQAALLQALGAERVLCLAETSEPAVLAVQHVLEGAGVQFHALRGFAALPALVRAEDDLIVLADGLVPDPALAEALLARTGEAGLRRVVATIPADHPLAGAHPEDFERIDAARCWAGVLAMRGAPVQHLADFPADADAISLLLRLALQAGTPTCDAAARGLTTETWLLAHSGEAATRHEADLIARAAPASDPRAPTVALAAALARALVPRGPAQGRAAAGGLAAALLLGGVVAAAFGLPAIGLGLAGLGAFAAQVAQSLAAIAARLGGGEPPPRAAPALLAGATDAAAALAAWFALAPWPAWQPLAVIGPVTILLARIVSLEGPRIMATAAADRAGLLLVLALGAALGLLPESLACLALGLLAALLLRRRPE